MTVETVKDRMKLGLPRYYDGSSEVDAIVGGQAYALQYRKEQAKDLLDQLFPSTATWGVSYWERTTSDVNSKYYDRTSYATLSESRVPFADLSPVTWKEFEVMYPTAIEHRRSNVIAKLRGMGTVTLPMVKNITESYAGGTVEITEDFANYTIIIKFVSEYGVPARISDIKQVLRDIIPAHLVIDYVFKYVTYDGILANYTDYNALSTTGQTYSQIMIGEEE